MSGAMACCGERVPGRDGAEDGSDGVETAPTAAEEARRDPVGSSPDGVAAPAVAVEAAAPDGVRVARSPAAPGRDSPRARAVVGRDARRERCASRA